MVALSDSGAACGRFRRRACDGRPNCARNEISLSHGVPPWLGLGPVGGTNSHRLAYYGITRTLWCYQNMARSSSEKVTPKKPGRPATGRDPVLTARFPPALRSAIENWAKQQ